MPRRSASFLQSSSVTPLSGCGIFELKMKITGVNPSGTLLSKACIDLHFTSNSSISPFPLNLVSCAVVAQLDIKKESMIRKCAIVKNFK